MLARIVRTDTSSAQFFIRIALAAVIFSHGARKALGWFGGPGFAATVKSFAASGYSLPLVLLLMAVETIGPAFLLVGFLTRIAALAIGASITFCLFANHLQYGFFMNWAGTQGGEGYEYHLLVIGMCLALLFRGGGLFSIDLALTPKRRFTSSLVP